MKFEIPKVRKLIRFCQYAEEFGEATIEVWVNFPNAVLIERNTIVVNMRRTLDELEKLKQDKSADAKKIEELQAKIMELGKEMAAWYAKVWTQKGQPVSAEEVDELFTATHDQDPQLATWLVTETFRLIGEYRDGQKN